MSRTRRLLHPTDFSPASRPAFRKAVELAKILREELVVVHVLAVPAMATEAYIVPAVYDDLLRTARSVAQRQLGRLVTQARRAGARVSSRLVEGSPAHERIAGAARGLRADLIVMGTHGRSGISRVFLGSVAARVVAIAPCPVLTVRAR